MHILILAAAAALNATSAGAAETPVKAPAATPARDAKPADPVTCHDEVVAGSRLPTRVCIRRSTAEGQARDGRNMTEHMQTGVVTHGARGN